MGTSPIVICTHVKQKIINLLDILLPIELSVSVFSSSSDGSVILRCLFTTGVECETMLFNLIFPPKIFIT